MEHDADALADAVRIRGWVKAQHADGARGGGGKALAHFDGRRLAGAIGTEEAQQLAAVHVEAQAVDGAGGTESLDHGVDDERCLVSVKSCIHGHSV